MRKHRTGSGLIRYDPRRDIEWAQVAREIIAAEKPKFIVMMIGLNDRQSIRERAPAPRTARRPQAPASRRAPRQPAPQADPELQAQQSADQQNAELQGEPDPARRSRPSRAPATATGPFEFRTEKWEAAYVKRIDDTIAALKSNGVPVFWVGLPALRGPRATTDAAYLNELYRSRAEKAGIIYVDVWDGFVDEAGRFTLQGPDFEGQIRRLRSGDGVYFTKAGARKLAHYVEREIAAQHRQRAVPVALPARASDAGGRRAPSRAAPSAAAARRSGGAADGLADRRADELLAAARRGRAAPPPIRSRPAC